MVNPLECIQQKQVPARLKKLVADRAEAMRRAYPDEDDAAIAARVADRLESDLNLKEQNLLRIAEKQLESDGLVRGHRPGRQIRRLLNKYEGSDLRLDTEYLSVQGAWAVERAILDDFMGEAYQEFTRRIATPGVSRSKGMMRNLEREMFGEATGDQTAARMARQLRSMDKYIVDSMRKHGVRMNWDPQRQFIVEHNPYKVGHVAQDEWVGDIVDRLDLSRMTNDETGAPFTREEILPVLSEIYESIRTHGVSEMKPGVRKRVPFWEKLDQPRFFIWKDHASWKGYNQKYGFDDSWTALVRYMDQNARNLALAKVLGPDPEAVLRYDLDLVRKATAEQAKGSKRKSAGDRAGALQMQQAFDILSGAQMVPGRLWMAEFGGTTRNLIQSVVLGGTSPLALAGDSVTSAFARKLNGISVAMQLPQLFDSMLRLGVKGPRSQVAKRALEMGVPLQSIQNSVLGSMRAIGEFDGRKWSHLFADTTFRGTGLTLVTDAQQAAFGVEFVQALTRNLGRDFSQFDDGNLARTLALYGVEEADWKRVGSTAPRFLDGRLDLLQFTREVDYDLGSKLMQMVHTELNQRAVITRSPQSQRRLQQGTQPGTVIGEADRFATNLLSWPMTYLWTQIGARYLTTTASTASKATQIAGLGVAMTIVGALVQQFREVSAGRDPLAWDDPRLWMGAAATGGGFGIMGDYLFREHYGSNDSFLLQALGPGFALGGNIVGTAVTNAQALALGEDTTFGRDAVRTLRQVTPLSTAWYLRTAMDRLFFNELERWLDPDAQKNWSRQRRARARDRDQDFWWAPGERQPRRAPDLGRLGTLD